MESVVLGTSDLLGPSQDPRSCFCLFVCLLYLFDLIWCGRVSIHNVCVCGACGGQKRAPNTLELEGSP